jgi:hypothetical protein
VVGDAPEAEEAGAEEAGAEELTGGNVLETAAGADEDVGGAVVGAGVVEPVLQPVMTNEQTNNTTTITTRYFITTSFNSDQ